jgi:hypothetical protein
MPYGMSMLRVPDPPGHDPTTFTRLRYPVEIFRHRTRSCWRESPVYPLGLVPHYVEVFGSWDPVALSPNPALSRVKFFILLVVLKLGAFVDAFLRV